MESKITELTEEVVVRIKRPPYRAKVQRVRDLHRFSREDIRVLANVLRLAKVDIGLVDGSARDNERNNMIIAVYRDVVTAACDAVCTLIDTLEYPQSYLDFQRVKADLKWSITPYIMTEKYNRFEVEALVPADVFYRDIDVGLRQFVTYRQIASLVIDTNDLPAVTYH